VWGTLCLFVDSRKNTEIKHWIGSNWPEGDRRVKYWIGSNVILQLETSIISYCYGHPALLVIIQMHQNEKWEERFLEIKNRHKARHPDHFPETLNFSIFFVESYLLRSLQFLSYSLRPTSLIAYWLIVADLPPMASFTTTRALSASMPSICSTWKKVLTTHLSENNK